MGLFFAFIFMIFAMVIDLILFPAMLSRKKEELIETTYPDMTEVRPEIIHAKVA